MERVLSSIWRAHALVASSRRVVHSASPAFSTQRYAHGRSPFDDEPKIHPKATIDHVSGQVWKRGYVHRRAREQAMKAQRAGLVSGVDMSSARTIKKALKNISLKTIPQHTVQYYPHNPKKEQESGQHDGDASTPAEQLADEDIDDLQNAVTPKNPESRKQQRTEVEQRWRKHRAAIARKLNGETWAPTGKKLSPDTMDGIRAMHNAYPEQLTTPVLAKHFEVSPEAIRRILRSKWKPTEEEDTKRRERWEERGKQIWDARAQAGYKVPNKWQSLGVGEEQDGEAARSARPARTVESAGPKQKALSNRGNRGDRKARWEDSPRRAARLQRDDRKTRSEWWEDNVAAVISDSQSAASELPIAEDAGQRAAAPS